MKTAFVIKLVCGIQWGVISTNRTVNCRFVCPQFILKSTRIHHFKQQWNIPLGTFHWSSPAPWKSLFSLHGLEPLRWKCGFHSCLDHSIISPNMWTILKANRSSCERKGWWSSFSKWNSWSTAHPLQWAEVGPQQQVFNGLCILLNYRWDVTQQRHTPESIKT